jgi:8-oxo-dGTP diphosphatase
MIVVAGVLEREGKILIGQRMIGDRHALKWEFPGGKLELGETPKQALRRELDEELGVEAVIGCELARYEHSVPGRPPLTLLFHRVESFTGEPEPRTFEQIQWAAPDTLPGFDFLDGDLDFVRRIAMGRVRQWRTGA